ncbi:unnamed protein product, partial [Trichogramma brassicae]
KNSHRLAAGKAVAAGNTRVAHFSSAAASTPHHRLPAPRRCEFLLKCPMFARRTIQRQGSRVQRSVCRRHKRCDRCAGEQCGGRSRIQRTAGARVHCPEVCPTSCYMRPSESHSHVARQCVCRSESTAHHEAVVGSEADSDEGELCCKPAAKALRAASHPMVVSSLLPSSTFSEVCSSQSAKSSMRSNGRHSRPGVRRSATPAAAGNAGQQRETSHAQPPTGIERRMPPWQEHVMEQRPRWEQCSSYDPILLYLLAEVAMKPHIDCIREPSSPSSSRHTTPANSLHGSDDEQEIDEKKESRTAVDLKPKIANTTVHSYGNKNSGIIVPMGTTWKSVRVSMSHCSSGTKKVGVRRGRVHLQGERERGRALVCAVLQFFLSRSSNDLSIPILLRLYPWVRLGNQ